MIKIVPNIDVWLGVLYEPVPYDPGRTHRAQMISSPEKGHLYFRLFWY